LGNRYEIVRSLGVGGMGAAYLARDREVGRPVALKVIRTELAGEPSMLKRFRKELVLARRVTHPNVVRIFDLGVMDGVRFISMEFIEGQQLSTLFEERGKLPAKDAAEIVLQVCRGLSAVHSQGVVHRDLKPANIMIDKDGRAVVMDFGIAGTEAASEEARSSTLLTDSLASMTRVGDLIGTPMYMSPEQSQAQSVDARSDLFTIGIIFYEMLTGDVPFRAESLRETLRKRCEETAISPSVLDPSIPKAISQIVLKCLQINPDDRYQDAGELIHDLEKHLGISQRGRRDRKWMIGSLVAPIMITGGFFLYERHAAEIVKPHPPVKILIADFDNQTRESVFNGALEPLLSFAMEDTPFLTSYNRIRARAIVAELRPGTTRLDATAARLVALREGVKVVISGAISVANGDYRVSVKADDSVQGTPIKSSEVTARNRNELLRLIGKLALPIREALGDTTPKSVKSITAETFSAASLEAAQRYSQAQAAQQSGQWEDAVRLYGETIKLDPDSGRAYAGMASTLANMGRRQDAQKYYEIALTKLYRMSVREKYRTRGGYFLLMGEYQQAMEQSKALVAAYPDDAGAVSNLAYSYFLQHDMTNAMSGGRRAVELYPGDVLYRLNAGLFSMYAGDFEIAILDSREALKINPRFAKAYLCIALAQLARGKTDTAQATWGQLAVMGDEGASAAAIGLADLALYQGRYNDVTKMLPAAVAADVLKHNGGQAALKRIALAQAYLANGDRSRAVAAAEAALGDRTDEPVVFPAAEIFLEAEKEPEAMAVAATLRNMSAPAPRAYAAVIEGLLKLKHKDYLDAVSTFQEAQKLSDTWLGRLALARAYLEAGAFAEAESELDNCIQRLGEATSVFLDDEPTLRYLPAAYYYRGRAREALRAASAGDDYRIFLEFKAQSQADPLVVDARRRVKR